jgi:hypothetical protein
MFSITYEIIRVDTSTLGKSYAKWVYIHRDGHCVRALHHGYETDEVIALIGAEKAANNAAGVIEVVVGYKPEIKRSV